MLAFLLFFKLDKLCLLLTFAPAISPATAYVAGFFLSVREHILTNKPSQHHPVYPISLTIFIFFIGLVSGKAVTVVYLFLYSSSLGMCHMPPPWAGIYKY